MNINFSKRFLPFFLICLLYASNNYAYNLTPCLDCSAVIFTGVLDTHTDNVKVGWFDFNDDPIEWELEIGPKGFQAEGEANVPPTNVPSTTFINLNPGTAYNFYVRTVCAIGMSEWAGPFFFRTHFISPSQCQANIAVKDDNCSVSNDFGIEIMGYDDEVLGDNLFLNQVNLIIQHPFPSDLEISLISPNGQTVELSTRNGIASDHYGDPTDLDCKNVVSFSMNACKSIIDGPKPYIGSYQPEGDLNSFHNGESPNGIWILKVCDIALGDEGIIKYVEIDFTTSVCQVPQNVFINNVQNVSATLNWSNFENCEDVFVEYGISGFETGSGTTVQYLCSDLSGIINNLIPNTLYELEIQSNCGENNSPISCRMSFTTSCHPVSISENFDSQIACAITCENACPLDGLWFNSSQDSYDWLVRSGATPTEFTGPSSDLNGIGQYVYIESFGTECNINRPSYLESNCVFISSNNDGCDMSFKYHMSGLEINKLLLETSIDNGLNWITLWEKEGDQGNKWNHAVIDLNDFDATVIKFRFNGYGALGSFGDIAIDNIEFYGSLPPSDDMIKYYVDLDGDSYGDPNQLVFLCYTSVPEGFSVIAGDCNDEDASIYPGAEEIPCNLIDENCNGLEDDPIQFNPLGSVLIDLVHENCGDSYDGTLEISGTGGTSPYTYSWINGKTGAEIDSLTAGIYYCTIEDATGCITVSDFYEINTINDITLFVVQLTNPDCDGAENGLISINQSGGSIPYSYVWNNGDTSATINNLGIGVYTVTITDANLCVFESDPIILDAQNLINISVLNKNDVSCFGESDGQIILNIGSGAPPFDFNWSNGDSLVVANELPAGTYHCTITDVNGCRGIIQNIDINQPQELIIRLDAIDHNICNGGTEGSIETSIIGGSEPISFSWSNGGFSDDIFDLEAGFYNLTVTDNHFCSAVFSNIEIKQPDEILITVDSLKNVNCLLSSDGYISVDINGGVPPYQYFWNFPGSETSYIDGLSVRDYRLTILDVFACKKILDGIQIIHNDIPLELEINIEAEVLCNGDSTGQITALSFNGSPPFDFNWSIGERNINDEMNDTLSGLQAGNYDVTVTDSEGCVGITNEVELADPPLLSYKLNQLSNLKCYGDEDGFIDINIEGGTKPYQFNWSNNMNTEDIDALSVGSYTVTITDNNDCILITQEFEIQQPEELIINTSSSSAINNENNGSASVSVDGGFDPYFYLWDENAESQETNIATGLFPGEYFVTITDSRNCIMDTSVVVDNITSNYEIDFLKEFYLFPNPASREFTIIINLERAMNFEVRISNLLGQSKLIRHQIRSKELEHTYKVSNLAEGIYFIIFNAGNIQVVKKLFIIQ